MKMIEVLKRHALQYPLMQPKDAVKLIYQSEFGGGHLIEDATVSLNRLKEEYSVTPQIDAPLTECIGNGIVRVNLCALDAHGICVERLNSVFVRSANETVGDTVSFLEKLRLLWDVQRTDGIFNFTTEELETFLAVYRSSGYPAVSHSEIYRKTYSPAYRVVKQILLNTQYILPSELTIPMIRSGETTLTHGWVQ